MFSANSSPEKFGVVQTTDNLARVCSVLWFHGDATQELEDDVSVYDIVDHEDYTFRTGDVVLRLASDGSSDENERENLAPAGQVLSSFFLNFINPPIFYNYSVCFCIVFLS